MDCFKCTSVISDIRKLYEKKYAGVRPVPSCSTDNNGNHVCLNCSPDNVFFNLDYDWDSDQNQSQYLT